MESAVSSARVPGTAAFNGSLSAQQLVEIYRLMYLSRRVDDREILLKRQQKIFFQISARATRPCRWRRAWPCGPGYDWFFPYYRDRALVPGAGRYARRDDAAGRGRGDRPGQRRTADADALEQPRAAYRQHLIFDDDAAAACGGLRRGGPLLQPPSRGGRRRHEGDYRAFHDVTFPRRRSGADLPGRGFNLAGRVLGGAEHGVEPEAARDLLRGRQRLRDQRSGRGEYAGRQHLAAGGQLSQLPFCRDRRHRCRSRACVRFRRRRSIAARAWGRRLCMATVVRPYSHSLSDDDKLYRSAAEREADALRDPMPRDADAAAARGHSERRSRSTSLEQSLDHEAAEAAERALEAPLPRDRGHYRNTSTPKISTRPARVRSSTNSEAPVAQDAGKAGSGKSAIRAPWPT